MPAWHRRGGHDPFTCADSQGRRGLVQQLGRNCHPSHRARGRAGSGRGSGRASTVASLAPVSEEAGVRSAGGGVAARARVVIAEDEALIRMDLAEMLAEEGYDVVGQAADGARAIELAESERPDLVVLDVKMPVLD